MTVEVFDRVVLAEDFEVSNVPLEIRVFYGRWFPIPRRGRIRIREVRQPNP